MPDKTELDGWLLAHDIFDLAGGGGFETSGPPRVPGTNDLMDEEPFPEPTDPDLANVFWDGDFLQAFIVDENTGEPVFTQISPFDLSVYFDPDTETLQYWDQPTEAFVPIDFASVFGPDQLVFTTPPRAVNPDEESSPVTIEHRDALDVPVTIGARDVYLYSTDPDLVFMFAGNPVNGVTIDNGESSFTVTFVTPNAGNPVITASFEVLA